MGLKLPGIKKVVGVGGVSALSNPSEDREIFFKYGYGERINVDKAEIQDELKVLNTNETTEATFFVDGVGQKVGINTASPEEELEVIGDLKWGPGTASRHLNGVNAGAVSLRFFGEQQSGVPRGTIWFSQTSNKLGLYSVDEGTGTVGDVFIGHIIGSNALVVDGSTGDAVLGGGMTADSFTGTNVTTGEDPGHTHTSSSISISGFDTDDLSEGTNLYFTDARAETAISTQDAYLKNDGDTATGDYNFSSNTLFIDSSEGRIGMGTSTPERKLHLVEDGGTGFILSGASNSTSTNPFVAFKRSRGTHSSPLGLQNGDVIAQMIIQGHDGSSYDGLRRVLEIQATETWSSGNEGFGWKFYTRPNGEGGGPTRIMNLGNDGNVGIGTDFPGAKLGINTTSTTAGTPVLRLLQQDVSEEMIEFETTIGTGNAIEAVGSKTLTTTHFIKVTLPGNLTRYIPVGTIA